MEEFLTLPAVRELLEAEKADRGGLAPEQGYALQHVEALSRLGAKKARRLVEELMGLEFMSPFNAVKIADLLPREPEDVRAIFAKERFTLGKEDVERVLSLVEKLI